MRVFNFSAGPAVLPEPVLRQAAAEMLDWHGSGMSVMEMSHRGKEFIGIADKAEADLRTLLAIPANYKVLFLQGGAIAENAIVPMNLLAGRTAADYVNTGEWSKKSIKEAKKYCTVNVAASAEDRNFTYVPARETWKLDPAAAYVHVCTNETIGGVEYHWTPDTGDVPLVADMSSHILSRPIDVAKYGVIYGGAQKNIGPAGLTLVIVRDDLLDRALPITPSAFHWKEQAETDSMLNTPPTYAIYIAGLVFEWLLAQGGVAAIEQQEHRQGGAALRLSRPELVLRSPVRKEDRSRMNVPFKLADETLDAAFLKGAKERGMVQLKGHRSVGGMRASIYNAMPHRRRAGAGRLHEGIRAPARVTGDDPLSHPHAQPDLGARPASLSGRALHGRQGGRASRRDHRALARHARDGHPGQRQGHRPRRRRHQQHPGGRDVEARRAGVQRAGRQRQCGQGAGARGAADGRAQRDSGARATSRALDAGAPDLEAQVEDGKKQFAGVELPHRTLGIVGLGAIGSLVADTAIKLGMKVIGFDPEITVDAAWRLPSTRAQGEQRSRKC